MLRQFLDRALGSWRSDDRAPDEAPEESDAGSPGIEEPVANAASEESMRISSSRKIASSLATPPKYPLSWPARDLARTRRLQSRSSPKEASRGARPDTADEPDADPTAVWRPGDGQERDGR